jgi:hypothetical protein
MVIAGGSMIRTNCVPTVLKKKSLTIPLLSIVSIARVLTLMPAFSEKTLLLSVAHSLTTMVPCVPNVRTTASTVSLQVNVI